MPDSQSAEADIDDTQTRIEALGRVVCSRNQAHFENMIRRMQFSGVIDITDWTIEAVTALVKVCSDENLVITIKKGARYLMPVRYPHESQLDSFVKMIFTGHFK